MAATRSSDAGCGSPPMCRLSPTRVTSSRYGRDPHTGQHGRPGRDGGAVLAAVAVADHPAGGGADGGAGGAELHGAAPGRDRPLGVVARARGDEHAQQVRARALERGEGLPHGDLGRALQVRARRHPVAEPPSVRHACLPRSPPIVAAVGADGHHPPATTRPTATTACGHTDALAPAAPPHGRAASPRRSRRDAGGAGRWCERAATGAEAPERWRQLGVRRGRARAGSRATAGACPRRWSVPARRRGYRGARGRERSPGRRRW